MKKLSFTFVPIIIFCLGACAASSQKGSDALVGETSNQKIALNQLGYLIESDKIAIVPSIRASIFDLVDAESKNVVYTATLTAAEKWDSAGSERVKQADFTRFTTPGRYFIRVDGLDDSPIFKIDDDVYEQLRKAALKYYYLNRAGIKIEQEYAGKYARPIAHKDEQVLYHSSAEPKLSNGPKHTSSQKGWYDAGDYGKYVVNSGITTYTLLAAFEHSPNAYKNQVLNIPESIDNIPDILNEVLWNLEWLVTMQSADGGVYHKLTSLEWPGHEMPHEDGRKRYMIGKSTSATLNFAATLSIASRVLAPYDENKSKRYLLAAIEAWKWAIIHREEYYKQPSDVKSGEYSDTGLKDEFAWAAAELFITTKARGFFDIYKEINIGYSTPSWSNVSYLSLSSLLYMAKEQLSQQDYDALKSKQKDVADKFVKQHQQNAYSVAMQRSDFVWGSNSVALNKAMVLIQAAQLHNDPRYLQPALSIVDYILGRNPTGYSFVTGFGDKTPLYPHHRISQNDGIVEPVPGMLVGGPHAGHQDKCNYKFKEPAKSYSDTWCSYSTNEVAINWNAPLVYVLGMLSKEE